MSRRLVCGIGINDANYTVYPKIGGKNVMCPYYRTWINMLDRAYSPNYHEKHPTYKDVTVCKQWLTFSNFKAWMKTQDWENKTLDKDILKIGNKKYSPKKCIFISQAINKLLLDCAAARGEYPVGVSIDKRSNKYRAGITKYGKGNHLGLFNTPEEASLAYRKAKYRHILEVAKTQPKKIRKALIRHAKILLM